MSRSSILGRSRLFFNSIAVRTRCEPVAHSNYSVLRPVLGKHQNKVSNGQAKANSYSLFTQNGPITQENVKTC